MLHAFPIVREKDEAQYGRYRTMEMIINYMRALSHGDTEITVRA